MDRKTFEKALREKRIRRWASGPSLVKKELKVAEKDLAYAKESFLGKNFKWATIQGYYSTFHSARALLYSRKYKEESHYFLTVAIKVLFVDEFLIEKELLEGLLETMGLREKADYESVFSKEGARKAIKTAEKFLKRARELLDNN